MKKLCSAVLSSFLVFAAPAQSGKGLQNESLAYSVNWPSGLSLGEAQLSANRAGDAYQFAFHFDAAIPGFSVQSDAKASSTGQYCSVDAERQTVRGARKSSETTTFDQKNRTAERVTKSGGKTTLELPVCGKDALTYFYFLRQELAQGRLPVQQSVLYGAPYDVRMEFGGRQNLRLNSGTVDVDRIIAHIKGPSSDVTAELFFAHDETRTPVLIRVPLALGTFSMEISR